MVARIYKPAKTAMSSGTAKTKDWVLEFAPESAREIDPLMGWTSSGDTKAQVRLYFDSQEAAEDYAAPMGSKQWCCAPNRASLMCAQAAMARISPPTAARFGRINPTSPFARLRRPQDWVISPHAVP